MNRLLLVGHGRMGQLVEQLAPAYGFEVAGIVTGRDPDGFTRDHGRVDVAIDFTLPDAVPVNLPKLAGARHQRRRRHDRLAGPRSRAPGRGGPGRYRRCWPRPTSRSA